MSTKPMPFQPAPRPQPRVSPEQTRELAEATRDLGFGRTTSAPDAEAPVTPPEPGPVVMAGTTSQSAKTVKPMEPAAEPAAERMATLKVVIPDELWNALRHQALDRRVTVKYLVMEALAAKGYDVDLSKVSEDGRRIR